jgi:hypothetical protein
MIADGLKALPAGKWKGFLYQLGHEKRGNNMWREDSTRRSLKKQAIPVQLSLTLRQA